MSSLHWTVAMGGDTGIPRKDGGRVAWKACVAMAVLTAMATAHAEAEAALPPAADQVGLLRLLGAGLLGALLVKALEMDAEAQRWLAPVERVLGRMEHTADRQRLLRYGIVAHAVIDALDPDHEVSRDRRSYPHKLSCRSWNELERRVFRVYLKFVKGTQKYLGPPRRRPQGGGRRH